jgi:plasmid stabilization system protein ParE
MSKPRYTSAARADLVSILEYIAKDKPKAALSWIEKIE